MATWKADIKTTPTGSTYSVTVEAGASYVAKEEIERLYRPIFIRNLRQVSSGGSSSGSSVDVGGSFALIAALVAIWVIVEYWWIVVPVGVILGLLAWYGSRD